MKKPCKSHRKGISWRYPGPPRRCHRARRRTRGFFRLFALDSGDLDDDEAEEDDDSLPV